MIDMDYIEEFLRSKISLQEQLSETGEIPGSCEIELQIKAVETRTKARIKQSVQHGIEEMHALRFILNEITRPVAEE